MLVGKAKSTPLSHQGTAQPKRWDCNTYCRHHWHLWFKIEVTLLSKLMPVYKWTLGIAILNSLQDKCHKTRITLILEMSSYAKLRGVCKSHLL